MKSPKPYANFKSKQHWMRSLKVGDYVEDCEGKVIHIIRLDKHFYLPRWLSRLIYINLPYKIANKVDNMLTWLFPFLPKHYDSSLILENGSSCSAMHCCDHPIYARKWRDKQRTEAKVLNYKREEINYDL